MSRAALIRGVFSGGILALGLISQPAAAQWTASAEIGAFRFGGASKEITATDDHPAFRPHRPTTVGMRLERNGRVSLGIGMEYANAGLAIEGESEIIVAKGQMQMISFAPELGVRIGRINRLAELRAHAGPLIELWNVVESGNRTRLGAQAALALRLDLGSRIAGEVRAVGAFTPASPFEAELPDTYERTAMWRRGVTAGLGYRL